MLAWRFFEKACAAAGGRPAARALAEIAALPERGVATLEQIARAADVPEANAKKLADDLRAEHLVRKVDGGCTMSTEWARPLARAYTGEARGRGVAARLVMREKIEANGLLSIGQVREIQRFAGALAPEEEALVRRSRQVGMAVTGALLAVPMLGLIALYSSYGRNYFFDAAPDPGRRGGRAARAAGDGARLSAAQPALRRRHRRLGLRARGARRRRARGRGAARGRRLAAPARRCARSRCRAR